MPLERKKPPLKRRRDLPGFAAELTRAINRSGQTDTEISRATGISRSVLIGYKQGRTVPGASEIRSLCEALDVSPNRLLFGREQPFKTDSLRKTFAVTSDKETALVAVIFDKLTRGEKDALSALLQALFEARHGKETASMLKKGLKLIGPQLVKMAEELVESDAARERIAAMQEKVSAQVGDAPDAARGRKRKH